MSSGSSKPATRLHIGASRLERIAGTPTGTTIDPSWIHLGDPAPGSSRPTLAGAVRRKLGLRSKKKDARPELYEKTDFRSWSFKHGDRLDFENARFDFIYSEHVLEHFRFDAAIELLREMYRVLAPGGIARIAVPDADYRTYEAPEPAGYPRTQLKFSDPNKHKVRWNVYMLKTAMEMVGFEATPLVYCDEDGAFVEREPRQIYAGEIADRELALTLDYVTRRKSLIVDGRKGPDR